MVLKQGRVLQLKFYCFLISLESIILVLCFTLLKFKVGNFYREPIFYPFPPEWHPQLHYESESKLDMLRQGGSKFSYVVLFFIVSLTWKVAFIMCLLVVSPLFVLFIMSSNQRT